MDKKSTGTMALVLLVLAAGAVSPGGGQTTSQMQTTLRTPPPPAPVITAWGPKDKVATGEVIWFQGTNLNRDLLVVTLGDRAIMPHLYFEMLPAASSTAARFEFRTTSAMKTGVQTSTPLKVLHRGGPSVVLDADYHVVDRRANFSGISKFHAGNSSAYPIFTEGAVQIGLDNLDFANEGSGIYTEQVRLIRKTRETAELCPAPNIFGKKRTITYYDWTPVSIQRMISWRRDPAISTRIVLYGVGLEQNINATADLIAGGALQCGFIGYFGYSKPYNQDSGCGGAPLPAVVQTDESAGGPNAQLFPAQQPPPLTPAAPTYVAYSLRRGI